MGGDGEQGMMAYLRIFDIAWIVFWFAISIRKQKKKLMTWKRVLENSAMMITFYVLIIWFDLYLLFEGDVFTPIQLNYLSRAIRMIGVPVVSIYAAY